LQKLWREGIYCIEQKAKATTTSYSQLLIKQLAYKIAHKRSI